MWAKLCPVDNSMTGKVHTVSKVCQKRYLIVVLVHSLGKRVDNNWFNGHKIITQLSMDEVQQHFFLCRLHDCTWNESECQ